MLSEITPWVTTAVVVGEVCVLSLDWGTGQASSREVAMREYAVNVQLTVRTIWKSFKNIPNAMAMMGPMIGDTNILATIIT